MKEITKLELLLKEGKITRRDFLARVSAMGLMAAVSPALFTKPALASTPKKGGRLRIGCYAGQTTDNLDPALLNNIFTILLTLGHLRNCLVEFDHKSNPIPELAEGWDTPDAKKYVFTLRKGVEFHNGKTMDAEDVVFSIKHHSGEKSKSAAKVFVEQIQEIKSDGKYTVAMTLKKANIDFPVLLADHHLQIIPNGTTNFDDGLGTGGYKLVSWEPGVRSHTKRNPNYWKEGRAHFDEVETTVIADANSRTNALITGLIDVDSRSDEKTVDMLQKKRGIQIVEKTGNKHYVFPMLTDVPPFDNNDVRLALKYAVDREQLLKLVLRGHGIVGNDHPIGPNQHFFAHELPQREYDPDKAKYYLKKANITDYTFELYSASGLYPGSLDDCLLYSEHAAKAGIKIKVVRVAADGYWTDIWMKKPWAGSFWQGRPSEDAMFSSGYAADAKWNESHWKHKRFNELLEEARAKTNETKRRELYVEMQKIVRDEGGTVIPLFANFIMAANDKLKFGNIATDREMDGMRLAERWWFES